MVSLSISSVSKFYHIFIFESLNHIFWCGFVDIIKANLQSQSS